MLLGCQDVRNDYGPGIDPGCYAIATSVSTKNGFSRPVQGAGVGDVRLLCIRWLPGAANSARRVDLYSKSRFRSHCSVGFSPSVFLPRTEQVSVSPNRYPCLRLNIAIPEKGCATTKRFCHQRRKGLLTMIIHCPPCDGYKSDLILVQFSQRRQVLVLTLGREGIYSCVAH